MNFPDNANKLPFFIYLDTTNQALVKPYDIHATDSDLLLSLAGFSLSSGEKIKTSVILSEFTPPRFIALFTVEELLELTKQMITLDTNSFFGGSFPNIPLPLDNV